MKTYKDLDVYKRAYKLAIEIHKFSLRLPREYKFELADQIRRASRSIPSNIAEGISRNKSKKDIVNLLRDAFGSNNEMLFNLEFMKDTDLLKKEKFDYFFDEYTICGKQLFNLIKSFKIND